MAVVEGVNENLNAIVVREIGVARHLRADDLVRGRVVAHHADVKILAVVKQPHLCRLARFFTLTRLALEHLPDWCNRFPIRLVQDAIDGDSRSGPGHDGPWRSIILAARTRCGRVHLAESHTTQQQCDQLVPFHGAGQACGAFHCHWRTRQPLPSIASAPA